MSGFIAKQPNGLYCRFSNVTDCVTDINMTTDDYIQMCVDKWGEASRIDALETLDYYVTDFSEVISSFMPNNMSVKEFRKQLKEMGYDGEYKY